jgi:peptide/nickel transport system permease protein
VQYARYLGQLVRGNLGDSFSQHRPVSEALAEAVPNTLVLAGSALVLDFVVGIALGVFLAARARRASAALVDQVTLFFYSLPTFWLGMVLLLVFSVWLRWLPAGGITDSVVYPSLGLWGRIGDRLWHLILPAATLGLVGAAGTARFQRAALLEVLHADFIRTARAKGLRERRVLLVHALRNALLPVITLFGLALPFLLTGAVLIETVFSWPGLGKLAVDAIFARDYPLVVAAAILASVTVAGGSLVADVLYAAADPRIRVGET